VITDSSFSSSVLGASVPIRFKTRNMLNLVENVMYSLISVLYVILQVFYDLVLILLKKHTAINF